MTSSRGGSSSTFCFGSNDMAVDRRAFVSSAWKSEISSLGIKRIGRDFKVLILRNDRIHVDELRSASDFGLVAD